MISSTPKIKLTFKKFSSTFILELLSDSEIIEKDFIEIVNDIKFTHPNLPYKVLIITPKHSSATKKAISYLADDKYVNRFNKGEAIVTNNLMIQLSANFYGKFIAKSRKIKVFKTEVEAIIWLDTLPLY